MITVRYFSEKKRTKRLSFLLVLFIASLWSQGICRGSWDGFDPAAEPFVAVSEKNVWVDPIVFSDLSQEVFDQHETNSLFKRLIIQRCEPILCDELKIFWEREKAFDRLLSTCLIMIFFKFLVHCYHGVSSPLNRLSSYVSFESSSDVPGYFSYGETDCGLQHKISLADIVELIQFLSEDLAKIDLLERADREDILQVLHIRKNYLERKLKEFGIFRYSPPPVSSESMHSLFALGFGLGLSIFFVALTTIDFDADALFLQVPSKKLLFKNWERFSYLNNHALQDISIDH